MNPGKILRQLITLADEFDRECEAAFQVGCHLESSAGPYVQVDIKLLRGLRESMSKSWLDEQITEIAQTLEQYDVNGLDEKAAIEKLRLVVLRLLTPLKVVEQDILTVDAPAVIVHQVNCQGVMGRGLADSIRQRWPIVFDKYKQACDRGHFKLGTIQPVAVADGLWVCNLAGQDRYGTDQQYTDYAAVKTALIKLRAWAGDRPIYLPYEMGCGLGGGKWEIMQQIILETVPDAIVCRKNP